MNDVIVINDNQFFKSIAAKVLGQYYNSGRKLCDIIEEDYNSLSVPGRTMLLNICESAIPLSLKLEFINKGK